MKWTIHENSCFLNVVGESKSMNFREKRITLKPGQVQHFGPYQI